MATDMVSGSNGYPTEITRLAPTTIIVLGGADIISISVGTQLGTLLGV